MCSSTPFPKMFDTWNGHHTSSPASPPSNQLSNKQHHHHHQSHHNLLHCISCMICQASAANRLTSANSPERSPRGTRVTTNSSRANSCHAVQQHWGLTDTRLSKARSGVRCSKVLNIRYSSWWSMKPHESGWSLPKIKMTVTFHQNCTGRIVSSRWR